MASSFGGNRLEAGIHAFGYKEATQISPSSVQAVLHGETAFSPAKIDSRSNGSIDIPTTDNSYYFSFIGGKIRKQNLPHSLFSTKSQSQKRNQLSRETQSENEEGLSDEGAITLHDMEEAIACAVDAQEQLRSMSFHERRSLLEHILSSPFQTMLFDGETIFAATKEINADQQDRQHAMETISYFMQLFRQDIKGQFLFESNTTEGQFRTTLYTLSRGVVGVLLSNDVGLTPMANILAPAIMSGCALVIKVSHSNPLIGYMLSKILEAAHLTVPGVINIVSGLGDEIGKALVIDDRVEKIIYCGSIHTACKIQHRMTWFHLQKIHFRTPFSSKGVAMVFKDADVGSALIQYVPDLLMQSIVDGNKALQRNRLVEIKHIFVEEEKWHEVCLEVRGCLNTMRDNYEKFPNKVLSPKLRQDSVMGIQSMSFSGASTISSKCAIQKHYNMNQQTRDYIEEMMNYGADVYSVPIPIHGTGSEHQSPIMFSAIFSDSAKTGTCSFQHDLVGPLLHFHRCANSSKVTEFANRCLVESHAWYQIVFAQASKQRDQHKCWLNSDLHSSCVLLNHCYHNIQTKVMDHDVLEFFLKRRSVSIRHES